MVMDYTYRGEQEEVEEKEEEKELNSSEKRGNANDCCWKNPPKHSRTHDAKEQGNCTHLGADIKQFNVSTTCLR